MSPGQNAEYQAEKEENFKKIWLALPISMFAFFLAPNKIKLLKDQITETVVN